MINTIADFVARSFHYDTVGQEMGKWGKSVAGEMTEGCTGSEKNSENW